MAERLFGDRGVAFGMDILRLDVGDIAAVAGDSGDLGVDRVLAMELGIARSIHVVLVPVGKTVGIDRLVSVLGVSVSGEVEAGRDLQGSACLLAHRSII